MKKPLHYIVLIMFLLSVTHTAHAQSRSRRNNAAVKQRAAAAAARAKADADAQKKAEDNYNSLHPYLPNVTVSELKGMSSTDLRALYQKSYEAQGMKMMEAKEKAAALSL